MNRIDLQNLCETRLREARALFAVGEYSGCYYLSGYAVECALKACIAKGTQLHDFPDREKVQKSYQHDPVKLVIAAGLSADLQAGLITNTIFVASWNIVRNWSEQSRYEVWGEVDAKALLDAIESNGEGVLPWLKQRW